MARGERCWQGLDDDPHWIIHSVDDFATIMMMMMILNIMKIFVIMMISLQWHAGNMACKVLMMIRTGGYILSSLMLIVLSIDRFTMTITILIPLQEYLQSTGCPRKIFDFRITIYRLKEAISNAIKSYGY